MNFSKKTLTIVSIFILILIFFLVPKLTTNKASNQKEIFSNTISISKNYLNLRKETDRILLEAKNYKTYKEWNKDLTVIINKWEDLITQSDKLWKQAIIYSKWTKNSFNFSNIVFAYSSQEISNVFDKAPAGKKIATLAKYLGVDAKRAFKILQNDQEFVKADAWNKAGDTFQTLETSAIVIKDGCKVAGFVWWVIISGGAAGIAGASTLSQTALLVNGADLILEVSEDGATISLGNNNKVSEIIGKIRSITEPAASILAISDMPGNLEKGFDKFNAIMFGADQLRSVVQDGKIIGIDISSTGKIEASSLTKQEAKDWLKEKNNKQLSSDIKEIMDALDEINFDDIKTNSNNKIISEKDDESIGNNKEKQDISPEENGTETKTEKSDKAHKSYSKNGETYIIITSPEEYTFFEGQGRLWEVKVENYDQEKQGRPVCNWEFYINEKKNREMNSCKFLTDIRGEIGVLKVKVTVDFTKSDYKKIDGNRGKVNEITESIITTRNYEIIPTPKDNFKNK